MRIIRIILIWIGVSLASHSFAQQQTRLEIDIKPNQPKPEIVPVDEYGFIIFNPYIERKEAGDAQFKMEYYDAYFEKIWDKDISFNKKLNLEFYEFFGDGLYLIFNNPGKDVLEIVTIKVPSGFVNRHEFFISKGTQINDFVVSNDKVFIAGSTKRTPIVQQLDLATNKIITLPSIVEGKEVKINEIFIDEETGQLSVVISSLFDKTKNAVIRTFYGDQSEFNDLVIKAEERIDFHTAKVTNLTNNIQLVLGSYGYRNSSNTQGFYMAKFIDGRQEYLNFHSFTDLDNFFDFMTPKSQERVKEKAERKKESGKDLRINYRLLIHEVQKYNGQYVMVGEAYFPVYRRERYVDYYGLSRYYNYRNIFDGNQFTHAVIAGFDENGKLLWDHSFKINEIKTMNLKEKVKSHVVNDEITLFYNFEGQIRKLTVNNDDVNKIEEAQDLNTIYEDDQVKRADLGAAEYWYDNYFIAWGYQKIKNDSNEDVRKKRNIFYVNKMSF